MSKEKLLEVKNLSLGFNTDDGYVEIINDVSFSILEGEVFGLVGESGCGKTVTALSIMKLLPQPGAHIRTGEILLKGKNILTLTSNELQELRGKDISFIFQEPSAALNPLLPIGKQLDEVFLCHNYSGNSDDRVNELLKRVGFADPQRILALYPHELSGGMLQRVMIAMSLLLKPSLIIADEPTTALDVTIQAQIMELLIELKDQEDTSILLITHNLNLIAQYADRLAVMYAGRIAEESPTESFLKDTKHPYSSGLLAALPNLSTSGFSIKSIPGQVPQPVDYVNGCRFYDRCEKAFDKCDKKPELESIAAEHRVACFLYEGKE